MHPNYNPIKRDLSLEEIEEGIKIHKKNISKLENKIKGIKKLKHIKLTEGQRRDYESWNNELTDIMIPYKDEKDYLVRRIKRPLGMQKHLLSNLKKMKICAEKGHNYKTEGYIGNGLGPGKVQRTCTRCRKTDYVSSTINPTHIILR